MMAIEALDDPVEPYRPAGPAAAPILLRPGSGASGQDASAHADVGRLTAALGEARAEIERLQAALKDAEQRADHDPLTGLLNRRGFEPVLARTLAACRRYRTDAALVYIDLDGFKRINDQFGHAAGDETLKAVAATLASEVRESDIMARLGGDEFALILNRADRAAADAKAESLARAVEAAPAGPGGPVRLSYGVRSYEPGMTVAQMLAEADAAMYVRKADRKRG